MKKYRQAIIYGALLLTAVVTYGFYSHTNRQKLAGTAMQGFAVVELFTSEGCSSCPAADALSGVITGENTGNVYVLSFHVDYWNRLGWKDNFSSSLYSDRQKQYAGILNLKSIYTPQMIVNGKTEFVGSDENTLRHTIQLALKNASSTALELRAGINDAKTVSVSYSSNNTGKNILNVALVQKHAEVSVKKGENAGRLLKHFNIVRDFKTLTVNPKISGSVTLLIPEGLSSKDFKVIAFLQNTNDLAITSAAETDIQ